MDEEEKIYYRYLLDMNTDEFDVSELDYYDNETLDEVNAAVLGSRGEYRFWMYSDSPDKRESFFLGINEVLTADHSAAHRLADTATRRLWRFNDLWKSIEEKEKKDEDKV